MLGSPGTVGSSLMTHSTAALRLGLGHIPLGLADDRVQIDARVQHLGAPHSREDEQRIDELSHLHRALGNQAQIAFPVVVELGTGRLLQQLRESADVPERRPQIVRHGVRKRLQLLVHRSQLIAALAELVDERLLPLAHRHVVELHRRLAAARAQQRQIVRHEQRGSRENREQQTARADFAGNRHNVDPAPPLRRAAPTRDASRASRDWFATHRADVPSGTGRPGSRYPQRLTATINA